MSFYDAIRVGASGAADDFEVQRSLRFDNGSSHKLIRTFGTNSSNTTKTLSVWVKRAKLGSYQSIASTTVSGFIEGRLQFTNTDQIQFTDRDAGSGSTDANRTTTQQFRDISAWYHIVLVLDSTESTADNRIKLYVNSSQITNFSSTINPASSYGFSFFRSSADNFIGVNNSSTDYFGGYLSEINFIDGQALTPSSFGETNATTGQWIPKDTSELTFGTNGFTLNFSDNSSTTASTLGKDTSGNGNNFTPNNFGATAHDQLKDTPTNNFATMSPLAVSGDGNHPTFSQGNLKTMGPNSGIGKVGATFGLSSGKWYVEAKITQGGSNLQIGIIFSRTNYANNEYLGSGSDYAIAADTLNKKIRKEGSDNQTSLGGMQNGDILAFAIDMDNGTFQLYNNGSTKGSQVSFTVANYAPVTFAQTTGADTGGTHWNFGADSSFAGAVTAQGNTDGNGQGDFYYSPPSGFLAVCSANLPDPTILLPNKHFNTVLYTGDGNSTRTLSNVLEFQPDWLWTKSRNAAYSHLLYDAVRGAGSLKSLTLGGGAATGNEGAALDNSTYGFLNSFDANGFSFTKGSSSTNFFNQSGINYVAWNWNAGDTDGATYTVKVVSDSGNKYRFNDFGTSAVTLDLAEGGTYTFDGSDSSMSGHPFVIGTAANGSEYSTGVTYQLDGASVTYSQYTSGYSSATTRKLIITVPASAPQLYYWCSIHSGMGGAINTNTTLGSSNFDGTGQVTAKVNTTAGFSILTYSGTGSAGTKGHGLGSAPQAIITKRKSGGTEDWKVYHKHITGGYFLKLNTNQAETSNTDVYPNTAPTSTVYSLGNHASVNASGSTYVAYVFSEVEGYSSFGKYIGNGQASSGPFVYTGFRPAWIIIRQTGIMDWVIDDATRSPFNESNATIFSNLSNQEYDGGAYGIDILSNGFKPYNAYNQYNQSGQTYVFLAFAESPFKNSRAR